jgi:hypothetical protein
MRNNHDPNREARLTTLAEDRGRPLKNKIDTLRKLIEQGAEISDPEVQKQVRGTVVLSCLDQLERTRRPMAIASAYRCLADVGLEQRVMSPPARTIEAETLPKGSVAITPKELEAIVAERISLDKAERVEQAQRAMGL